MPNGADDFSEVEATEIERAVAFRDALDEGIRRDIERIEQLEKENQQLQDGDTPAPSVPDPKLDNPIRNPYNQSEEL